MKKRFNLILVIISILITTIFSLYKISELNKEQQQEYLGYKNVYQTHCVNSKDFNRDDCLNLEQDIIMKENPEFYQTLTFFSVYGGVVLDFLAFIILAFLIIYELYRLFKDQIINNLLLKEKYNDFLKFIFKKSYKYIFLFPFILLMIILYLFFTTRVGNFLYGLDGFNFQPILFFILYILNAFILSAFYINVILCILRYKHNYFVSVSLSILIFISLYLIFDVIIGTIFIDNILLKSNIGELFSIVGIFYFKVNKFISPIIRVLFSFILYVISTFVLYFEYRDKEKLVIDIEKNNKEEL